MQFVFPADLKLHTVASGIHPCIIIDDSGTPGQKAGSDYLEPDRKTWAAVLLTHHESREVCEQMPGALEELKTVSGASEFHFAEIYANKKPFNSLIPRVRLAFFSFMRKIFEEYNFPVIVQTFGTDNLLEIRSRGSFPDLIGPFKTTQIPDMALLFLLIRIKQYISANRDRYPTPAYAALDEGFREAGRAIHVPNFDSVMQDGNLYTVNSSAFVPMQLADFAAFTIAKIQWLLTKENRSQFDNEFLQVMNGFHINFVNLTPVAFELESWNPRLYEHVIDLDRQEKQLSPYRKSE